MWLIIVIVAHLLNAIAFVIDKYLLTKSIPNPVVYSFYIGLLGLLGFVLAPFGLAWPGLEQFLLALLAGATFILALFFFFQALRVDDASRVVPFLGGTQPIFIFLLSLLFLAERLSLEELIAFLFLVTGGVIISREQKKHFLSFRGGLIFALVASLIFSLSFVLTKYVYLNQNFISGFVWSRLGGFLMALLFLFHTSSRFKILKISGQAKKSTGLLFITNQGLGALGFILINYAISLASVTLVNAMQGIQYAFLFLMVMILTRKFPHILKEKLTRQIIWQKSLAIILIGLGLVFLTR